MTVSERVTQMLGNQLIALAEKDSMIEQLQIKIAELEAKQEKQPKEDGASTT
jgi:hypothetical protein